jgi:LysR family transcriptional activator of nhaA
VPKSIAHQLIAPGLALEEPVKLVCTENRLERLVADLAIHRLDMVLADRPLPPNMDIRGYSHPLGECGIGFFATAELAGQLTGSFPRRLHEAPMLLPGEESALRAPLLRWLERQEVAPLVVGEFDDSALMHAFGGAGAGVFPVPMTREVEAALPAGVIMLGQTQELRERFFAISVERRLRHPAVVAISEAARLKLFARPGAAS